MIFLWPIMLGLLVFVPLGAVLYGRLLARRRRAAAQYGSLGLASGSAGRALGWRRHLPPAFFFAGLTVLIVALARPQTVVSLPRSEGTVILAFDVSGSMAAEDMEPTRMEAAKAAATDFVESQPASVQIGVVAFSDNGFAVQAPSNDQAEVLAAINRLGPQRGTSLGQGILTSLNTIALADAADEPRLYTNQTPTPDASPEPVPPGSFTTSVIVLMSDGSNNEAPDPLLAAQAAADRGVRIYTVGLGSPAGTTLNINGFTVQTRLDEVMLQQISDISAGTYYNAENSEDLLSIYDTLGRQLVIKPEETEITALLAGVGILALLVGGALSFLWFGRLP